MKMTPSGGMSPLSTLLFHPQLGGAVVKNLPLDEVIRMREVSCRTQMLVEELCADCYFEGMLYEDQDLQLFRLHPDNPHFWISSNCCEPTLNELFETKMLDVLEPNLSDSDGRGPKLGGGEASGGERLPLSQDSSTLPPLFNPISIAGKRLCSLVKDRLLDCDALTALGGWNMTQANTFYDHCQSWEDAAKKENCWTSSSNSTGVVPLEGGMHREDERERQRFPHCFPNFTVHNPLSVIFISEYLRTIRSNATDNDQETHEIPKCTITGIKCDLSVRGSGSHKSRFIEFIRYLSHEIKCLKTFEVWGVENAESMELVKIAFSSPALEFGLLSAQRVHEEEDGENSEFLLKASETTLETIVKMLLPSSDSGSSSSLLGLDLSFTTDSPLGRHHRNPRSFEENVEGFERGLDLLRDRDSFPKLKSFTLNLPNDHHEPVSESTSQLISSLLDSEKWQPSFRWLKCPFPGEALLYASENKFEQLSSQHEGFRLQFSGLFEAGLRRRDFHQAQPPSFLAKIPSLGRILEPYDELRGNTRKASYYKAIGIANEVLAARWQSVDVYVESDAELQEVLSLFPNLYTLEVMVGPKLGTLSAAKDKAGEDLQKITVDDSPDSSVVLTDRIGTIISKCCPRLRHLALADAPFVMSPSHSAEDSQYSVADSEHCTHAHITDQLLLNLHLPKLDDIDLQDFPSFSVQAILYACRQNWPRMEMIDAATYGERSYQREPYKKERAVRPFKSVNVASLQEKDTTTEWLLPSLVTNPELFSVSIYSHFWDVDGHHNKGWRDEYFRLCQNRCKLLEDGRIFDKKIHYQDEEEDGNEIEDAV